MTSEQYYQLRYLNYRLVARQPLASGILYLYMNFFGTNNMSIERAIPNTLVTKNITVPTA